MSYRMILYEEMQAKDANLRNIRRIHVQMAQGKIQEPLFFLHLRSNQMR